MEGAELFNLVINGGGTAILIWLVMDMRKEQGRTNDKVWRLLNYLAQRNENTKSDPPPLPAADDGPVMG